MNTHHRIMSEIGEDKKDSLQEYEKRVNKILSNSKSKKDPLCFFPKDNINVESFSPQRQEAEKTFPEDLKNSGPKLPMFAAKAIENINNENVIVTYNYKKYKKIPTEGFEKSLKSRKYEIDQVISKEEEKIKKKSSHVQISKKSRQQVKNGIFSHFSYIYDKTFGEEYEWDGGEEVNTCRRKPYQELTNLEEVAFCVKITSLKLKFTSNFGHLEPLFLSLSLYDTENNQKLSETFHLDLNSDRIMKKIRKEVITRNDMTTLTNAIFRVKQRKKEIVMLIVVSKILEGGDALDRYFTCDENQSEKLKKNVNEFCLRFGFLRQTLCYTLTPVFDDKEALILGKKKDYTFYKYEHQNFMKIILGDMSGKSVGGSKKIKTTRGEVAMDIVELGDISVKHYDMGIVSIKDQKTSKELLLARNIFHFPVRLNEGFNESYRNVLFIYPQNVHFSFKFLGGKSPKNVTIRVQLKSNYQKLHDTNAIKSIYGLSSQDLLLKTAYSQVNCSRKNPEFNDEIKIELPGALMKNHHLLFSFFDVAVGGKLKSKPLNSIGHSVLPILDENGNILDKVHTLEIFECKTKRDYKKNRKKKGGYFKIRVHNCSTIYPKMEELGEAFKNPSKKLKNLKVAFKNDEVYFLQNLPTIMNFIFNLMCNTEENKILTDSYIILLDIVYGISKAFSGESGRNSHLVKYVDQRFQNPKKCQSYPFLQLTSLWLALLQEEQAKMKRGHKNPGKIVTKSLQCSWWFFEVINKSIILYLDKNKIKGRLKDKHFCKILSRLIDCLSQQVVFRAAKQLSVAKEVNQSIALFLRDLFNSMDRGLLLSLIDLYLRKISKQAEKQKELIQEFRISFLKIVSDYEHYVPLSLPKKYRVTSVAIEKRLCDLSYLCGIVVRQTILSICDPEPTVRQRSFDLIKGLLTKHEYDSKYNHQDPVKSAKRKRRVIGMYFPFVLYFVDLLDTYKEFSMKKMRKHEKLLNAAKEEYKINSTMFKTTEIDPKQRNNVNVKENMSKIQEKLKEIEKKIKKAQKDYNEDKLIVKSEFRHALFSIITILHNMDRGMLKQWFKVESKKKVNKFIELLCDCVQYFEFRGKDEIEKNEKIGGEQIISSEKTLKKNKLLLEEAYSGGGISNLSLKRRRGKVMRRGSTPSSPVLDKVNDLQNAFATKESLLGSLISRNPVQSRVKIDPKQLKKKIKFEGIIGSQVSLVVLDILLDLNDVLRRDPPKFVDSILNLIMMFLDTNQSTRVINGLFDFLKEFFESFRSQLFLNDTPYSEKLCRGIIKKTFSHVEGVRSRACGVLFLLIKSNYLEMGNFTRTKTQTTTMISGMVKHLLPRSITLLHICFKAIHEYASEEKKIKPRTMKRKSRSEGGFVEQVFQLVKRLKTTLNNTMKIAEINKTSNKSDPESDARLQTLFIGLCKTYIDAPELCITWYKNLSDFHLEKKRIIEASQALCVVAGYSFQYQVLKNNEIFVKKLDYNLLKNCSSSLKNETFSEMRALFKGNEQPPFSSQYFTEGGFIGLCKTISDLMKQAEYYEYKISLCELLIQYYKEKDDYVKLVNIHSEIADCYKLINKFGSLNRMFGSYYFIGFYGKKFGKLNGKEYIYKFPKIFKLGEAMAYLEKRLYPQYGEKFVKIKSSTLVITPEITNNEKIVHVKIISVNPYSQNERKDVYFEKNVNVKKFIFETPFTKGKKSHAQELTAQWKRKTILEVNVPFPNLSFKNNILKTSLIELTPIQNACEIIEKTVDKLKMFHSEKGNASISSLQLVLSGTVIPQVQEGVPAIVKSFCCKKYAKDPVMPKLKQKLREFLEFNHKGIILNHKFQSHKTIALHNEFVNGYEKLYKMIEPKVGNCGDDINPILLKGSIE